MTPAQGGAAALCIVFFCKHNRLVAQEASPNLQGACWVGYPGLWVGAPPMRLTPPLRLTP